MYEVEAYEQEFHYSYVYHRRINFAYQYEDLKLTFPDVSYDEEAAKPIYHKR